MNTPPIRTRAPGKIILSGEHSVVHGRPALLLAVNRYVTCTLLPQSGPALTIHSELGETAAVNVDALRRTWREACARLDSFQAGTLSIAEVLDHPHQLLELCWGALDARFAFPPSSGLALQIRSALPPGSGMGSSAAVCAAVLLALCTAAGRQPGREELFAWTCQAERFQHGNPSGADPYITVHGGCVRFRKGEGARTLPPPAAPFFLVTTGPPESTTGETIEHVKRQIADHRTWQAFEEITLLLEAVLGDPNDARLRELVRRNHRLLVHIGVVPRRVSAFVDHVEAGGGAAKISGAGSVRGDAAGVVLVWTDSPPTDLCRSFGYRIIQAAPENHGVHAT